MGVSRNPFTLRYTPVQQVPAAAIEATPVQHTTSTAATKGRSPHWSYGFPRFVALSENGIYTYTHKMAILMGVMMID